jgi:hypothetical protein
LRQSIFLSESENGGITLFELNGTLKHPTGASTGPTGFGQLSLFTQTEGSEKSTIVSVAHVTHLPVLYSQASQPAPQDKQLFAPSLYYPVGHAVKSAQVVPSSNFPAGQPHLKSEVRMNGEAQVLH